MREAQPALVEVRACHRDAPAARDQLLGRGIEVRMVALAQRKDAFGLHHGIAHDHGDEADLVEADLVPQRDRFADLIDVRAHDRAVRRVERRGRHPALEQANALERVVVARAPADVLVRLPPRAVEGDDEKTHVGIGKRGDRVVVEQRAVGDELDAQADARERAHDLRKALVHRRLEAGAQQDLRADETLELAGKLGRKHGARLVRHVTDVTHPAAQVAGERRLDLDQFRQVGKHSCQSAL